MTQSPMTQEMLLAFVDGQLNDAEAAEVEEYLAQKPEAAAEVADWLTQNDSLRALFPAADAEIDLPEITIPTPANTRRAPLGAIAASVLMLGFGTAIGWFAHSVSSPPQNIQITANLVTEAINAHVVFAADKNRPVEIPASNEALLVKWLSNRLGHEMSVPDLRSGGFELVGGRLLASNDGPAAQFMYENNDGVRITLFAVKSSGDRMAAFSYKQSGETGSFYWQDETLQYAVVGDLPRAALNDLAVSVYQQFS